MKSKVCTKCGEEKGLDEFYTNKRGKGGRGSTCKKCDSIRRKKYDLEHKEEIAIQKKKYYEEHKEKTARYMKKYRLEHKEELKIWQKKYNLEYKEKIKKYNSERKEHYRKYYLKNKEKIDNYRRKYEINKRKNNIHYKITSNLRNRVSQAIKNNYRSLSTMFLIGCELDYLLYHLQSQFTEEMSWDNYGEWHVDHIRPCASFNLNKLEEQQKCFHYTNLQPLWAKDNISKRDKWNN